MIKNLFIALLVAFSVSLSGCNHIGSVWQKEEYSINIVSLNTVRDTKGSMDGLFVIGTGVIDGVLDSNTYYYVRAVYPEGTLIEKYDVATTYLVERDDISPQIIVSYETDSDVNRWKGEENKYFYYHTRNLKVTIVVPKNTIIKQFDASVK